MDETKDEDKVDKEGNGNGDKLMRMRKMKVIKVGCA